MARRNIAILYALWVFICVVPLLGWTLITAGNGEQALSIVQPAKDAEVAEPGFYIFGASNPTEKLYMDGVALTNRTDEGFFSVFVELSIGANVFVFSQAGQRDIAVTIHRTEPPAWPEHLIMREAGLVSVFPVQAEYVSVGDVVVFEAIAPVGAAVTVNFRGETLVLSPDHIAANPDREMILATRFSVQYTVSGDVDSDSIADLGRPVYDMEFVGQQFSAVGAPIRLIGKEAPFYATVAVETAWTFASPSTSGGSDWNLLAGQKGAVRAISGNGEWIRLDSGVWVEGSKVSLGTEDGLIIDVLTEGRVTRDGINHKVTWRALHYPVIRAVFDGAVLRVYFALQSEAPAIGLSYIDKDEVFFKDVTSGFYSGTPYLEFIVRDEVNLEGFYVSFGEGEFSLNVRTRRALSPGDLPLDGFVFVIDAGHGGADYGALGPMGKEMAEKHINLINARNIAYRLERLGASAILTRSSDVFFTLQERTEISRRSKPDMFISMHADSTIETKDAANIRGISFWYKNPNSRPLAEHFINKLHGINPRTTRHRQPNQANFFVCRPVWAPSVIVEASFMNNINDFAWMMNPENQSVLADGIVNAILSYYS